MKEPWERGGVAGDSRRLAMPPGTFRCRFIVMWELGCSIPTVHVQFYGGTENKPVPTDKQQQGGPERDHD
jgi:hypothetical protein